MKRYARELSVLVVLALILLLLGICAPRFYAPQPLLSRCAGMAPKLVLACGIALVLITRQIDISIGSLFAVCGTGAGWMWASGRPLPLVILTAVGLGALGGGLNGVLVAALRLPSIVVTLAFLVTSREALRLKQQGVFVNLPESAPWFGLPMVPGQIVVCGVALALFALLACGASRWAAGRYLYAVGTDAEAARLAGISPRLTTFGVFVLMGALTGIAAVLNAVQSPQVDPNTGRGLELEAIAAAVVGGVAVSGGRGNLWGVFAGMVLLTCIGPALTYLGVEAHWDKAIQGGIILLAVMADGLRRRKDLLG